MTNMIITVNDDNVLNIVDLCAYMKRSNSVFELKYQFNSTLHITYGKNLRSSNISSELSIDELLKILRNNQHNCDEIVYSENYFYSLGINSNVKPTVVVNENILFSGLKSVIELNAYED